jgi:uncharacterized protein (UPF0276 family)
MPAIWLAANGGNEHIEVLLASGAVHLDRIKVGSWMGDDQLTALCAAHPALLHVSRGVIWPRGERWIAAQLRLARQVDTPWTSVHLDIGLPYAIYRWPLTALLPRSLAERWAVRTLQRWAAQSPVPLLAENTPPWKRDRPAYVVDPAFITRVIEGADCRLLLDLAHARVSAHMRGQPARDYIAQLPLDRLIEIHVSGPRPSPVDGRLVDAHEPLQEEDDALLAWVLERVRPQAVTLEYTRDRAQLEAQLLHLRELLGR